MKFDVRDAEQEEITEIVFGEYEQGCHNRHACLLDRGEGQVYINNEGCSYFVALNSKEHALNLIKALNKAIELGWVK